VRGLAGIAPRRGRFLRPLLDVPRAVILGYVAERGLEPVSDPMNDDRSFLRARLRHDILPVLRRENPRVDAALCRTARALRETADALAWATARADADLGPGPSISATALAALPAAIAKRILCERAGAALEGRHLDAAWALVRGRSRGSSELHLPGFILRREYDALRFVPSSTSPSTQTDVALEDGSPPDGPYLVRTWQPGDRMRPPSLRGHSRKLSDLFIDRKIPASVRRKAVVVVRERDGAIVWAEHVGPSVDARLRVALTRRDPPAI
jgi:tRNA(Ile)-lysidine synthetase-like protein